MSRFLSQAIERQLPFFKVLKKAKKFERNSNCEKAFQELNDHLQALPLLGIPKLDEVIYPCQAVTPETISTILVQDNDGIQKPIYPVSRALYDAKLKYEPIEKGVLALLTTTRCLRPYIQAHKICVISDLPLRHVL